MVGLGQRSQHTRAIDVHDLLALTVVGNERSVGLLACADDVTRARTEAGQPSSERHVGLGVPVRRIEHHARRVDQFESLGLVAMLERFADEFLLRFEPDLDRQLRPGERDLLLDDPPTLGVAVEGREELRIRVERGTKRIERARCDQRIERRHVCIEVRRVDPARALCMNGCRLGVDRSTGGGVRAGVLAQPQVRARDLRSNAVASPLLGRFDGIARRVRVRGHALVRDALRQVEEFLHAPEASVIGLMEGDVRVSFAAPPVGDAFRVADRAVGLIDGERRRHGVGLCARAVFHVRIQRKRAGRLESEIQELAPPSCDRW